MAEIKRAFKTFNGSGWDTCYFDTDESQIVTGFNQDINAARGYKKFPGGQIHQFGHADLTTDSNGIAQVQVKLPTSFENHLTSITGSHADANRTTWSVGYFIFEVISLNSIKIIVTGADKNKVIRVYFDAWGY